MHTHLFIKAPLQESIGDVFSYRDLPLAAAMVSKALTVLVFASGAKVS